MTKWKDPKRNIERLSVRNCFKEDTCDVQDTYDSVILYLLHTRSAAKLRDLLRVHSMSLF